MNRDIVRLFTYVLPILALCLFTYVSYPLVGDYGFHYLYSGDGGYPSFNSLVLSVFDLFFVRYQSIFILNFILTVALPSVLIHVYTKDLNKVFLYLYSGLAFFMFWLWFMPQSWIHVFILLVVNVPVLFFPLFILSFFVHKVGWAGVLLAGGYVVYDRLYTK